MVRKSVYTINIYQRKIKWVFSEVGGDLVFQSVVVLFSYLVQYLFLEEAQPGRPQQWLEVCQSFHLLSHPHS